MKAAVRSSIAGGLIDGEWREGFDETYARIYVVFKELFENTVKSHAGLAKPEEYLPTRYHVGGRARAMRILREILYLYALPLFASICLCVYLASFEIWLYALTVDSVPLSLGWFAYYPMRFHILVVIFASGIPWVAIWSLAYWHERRAIRPAASFVSAGQTGVRNLAARWSAKLTAASIVGAAASITVLGPFLWEHGWLALYAGQDVVDPRGFSSWALYLAWPFGVVCFIISFLVALGVVGAAWAEMKVRRRRRLWLPR